MYGKAIKKIQELLPKLGECDISFLLPSPAEEEKLDNTFDLYGELMAISKRFLDDVTTISEVRALFDTVIVKNLDSVDRLREKVTTILQLKSENGVDAQGKLSHGAFRQRVR